MNKKPDKQGQAHELGQGAIFKMIIYSGGGQGPDNDGAGGRAPAA